MGTSLDTLRPAAPSSGSTLARDFDTEFRLLEDRIRARLRPRGLRGHLRRAVRLMTTGLLAPAPRGTAAPIRSRS